MFLDNQAYNTNFGSLIDKFPILVRKIITYIVFPLAVLILPTKSLLAQKIAYVDSDYILNQMPDFRSAQKQLDDVADKWKKEMQERKSQLDNLKAAYEAEYVLLPEDTRKKREEEINQKAKDYDAFKKERFGNEGELFKKRNELLKPIQDKVFEAIQKLANENKYDIVFDKAGAVTMLFSNAKYDRSDEVLEILGVTPGTQDAGGKNDKMKNFQKKAGSAIESLLKDDKDNKPVNINNNNPK